MKKRLFSIGMLAMAAVAAVAQTQYDLNTMLPVSQAAS